MEPRYIYQQRRGRLEVVKYLCDKEDADLSQGDQRGMTALHYAVFSKQEKVVNFLISLPDKDSFIILKSLIYVEDWYTLIGYQGRGLSCELHSWG